jgi:hypothetical protein
VIDRLREVAHTVAELLAEFDPAVVAPSDAARVVEEVAGCERGLAALRLLAAGRAAEGQAWRAAGSPSAVSWLAATTGTTAAEATATLETARSLCDTPGVEAALRAGSLSTHQAAAISSAATADPAAESRLLADARTATVEQLRRDCQRVRASADAASAEAAQARIHRTRYLRTYTDHEGAFCGRFRLTALAGATVAATLAAFHHQAFEKARAAGGREPGDALAADALVAMASAAASGGSNGCSGGGVRATVVARVDVAALERGHTRAGEESSIDGIGPVPVSHIRTLLTDALLVGVAADGDRIIDVRLAGRAMPSRLRHAVEARDRSCVVPGCGATRHLEIHHLTPVANGGDTYLDGLARVCTWHHDQITHAGAHLTRDPVPPRRAGRVALHPGAMGIARRPRRRPLRRRLPRRPPRPPTPTSSLTHRPGRPAPNQGAGRSGASPHTPVGRHQCETWPHDPLLLLAC